MKRVIAAMMAMCLGFCISGCSQEPARPTEQTQPQAAFTPDPAVPEQADAVAMDTLFSDGMCLQREKPLTITGATAAAHVAVELNGIIYTGTVDNGRFTVPIPALSAGGPYTMTVYTESAKKTVRNVYVGEVFLCSGQSNMEMLLGWCGDYHMLDAECANYDDIRILSIPKRASQTPEKSVTEAIWQSATMNTVVDFSCMAFLFAREMHEALGVPVGVVNASWGGSTAAFWMPKETYEPLSSQIDIYTMNTTEFTPCIGYNGLIAPLTQYTFRGVLWYQGCSNANATAVTYDRELKALIGSWRDAFRDESLAFTIIELPRYQDATYWPVIRLMQKRVADADPLACMSVSIDLGEFGDIHPKNKTLFAERAAEETLALLFDHPKPVYPTVKEIQRISENQVKLIFDGAGEGLVVKNDGNGFETSENGRNYRRISGIEWDDNSVTITSDDPIQSVRYGYRIVYTNVAYQDDVTLQVSVWNSYGNPLDQFEIILPDDAAP